jgi:hypothetical protein
MQAVWSGGAIGENVTPYTLLAPSQLASLTRVNTTARLHAGSLSELQAYSPAFDALAVELSGLKGCAVC